MREGLSILILIKGSLPGMAKVRLDGIVMNSGALQANVYWDQNM
jgi:hypothetical protein